VVDEDGVVSEYEIAAAGGGVAEAYPYDVAGKKVSGSFLHSGTRSMIERAGFDYDRPKGKNHCVMRKVVEPRSRDVLGDRPAQVGGDDSK
jgi:hypothetical protein